jgi:hypothetical protein
VEKKKEDEKEEEVSKEVEKKNRHWLIPIQSYYYKENKLKLESRMMHNGKKPIKLILNK